MSWSTSRIEENLKASAEYIAECINELEDRVATLTTKVYDLEVKSIMQEALIAKLTNTETKATGLEMVK